MAVDLHPSGEVLPLVFPTNKVRFTGYSWVDGRALLEFLDLCFSRQVVLL